MTHLRIGARTRDVWAAISADPHASIRELMRRCGFRSTSIVRYHLGRLEAQGYIKQTPYAARARQVIVWLWTVKRKTQHGKQSTKQPLSAQKETK